MDLELELILLPVADVDRAEALYADHCGFQLDVDHLPSDQFRVVQPTPPGSACSIAFGIGAPTTSRPGRSGGCTSFTEIAAARDELSGRGVPVSDIRHTTPAGWKPGAYPSHAHYASFGDFGDPDGNAWALQEVGHPDATS